MFGIALVATLIGFYRSLPYRIGGWRAAIVWNDSLPFIMLSHKKVLPEWYPRTCNSPFIECDQLYEVPSITVVVVTALTATLTGLVIHCVSDLRRQRSALMGPGHTRVRPKRGVRESVG
jgi:hypothetical protein